MNELTTVDRVWFMERGFMPKDHELMNRFYNAQQIARDQQRAEIQEVLRDMGRPQ